jgi:hypothetical protein
MSGECLVCDELTDARLLVGRDDGTAYLVPMCVRCLDESNLRSGETRHAHELIDARNNYRARCRLVAAA